jgi:hypothetical protein
LTSGMKRWWNHSVNKTAVTHVLRLWKRQALSYLVCPAALPHSTSVSLFFHALNPGTCFALLWTEVLLGIFFQNRPVSSQLET